MEFIHLCVLSHHICVYMAIQLSLSFLDPSRNLQPITNMRGWYNWNSSQVLWCPLPVDSKLSQSLMHWGLSLSEYPVAIVACFGASMTSDCSLSLLSHSALKSPNYSTPLNLLKALTWSSVIWYLYWCHQNADVLTSCASIGDSFTAVELLFNGQHACQDHHFLNLLDWSAEKVALVPLTINPAFKCSPQVSWCRYQSPSGVGHL